MSFQKLMKLNWVQIALSILVLCCTIIFICLLAIRQHHEQVYKIPGFIFLGITLALILSNFLLTLKMNQKINSIERYSNAKYKGWLFLYMGVCLFWMGILNRAYLRDLAVQIIEDSGLNEDYLADPL